MIFLKESLDLDANHSAHPLMITDKCPEVFKIIRLLSGAVEIVMPREGEEEEDKIVVAHKNYIRPDQQINNENSSLLVSYIFDEAPEQQDFRNIALHARGRNPSFYKSLCDELSLCVFSTECDRYTEAFLFLYRALERMSAACPLIYTSRQNDFRSAHDFLSGLYKDKKSPGELGLLRNFLVEYSKGSPNFNAATLDIPISNWGGDFATELARQWRDVIQREAAFATIDSETGIITCPYPKVASLIVTMRNRSFHNLSGQKNLDLFRLKGAEPVFSVFVPYFLQWTAHVFLDFARWQISSIRL
ncbi:hypothetical protein [Palleronia sp.]|uniref:hypothetical protein n=1 Tax=Palleronia sp. TaxID=1940284 RepID=UPI0035C84563